MLQVTIETSGGWRGIQWVPYELHLGKEGAAPVVERRPQKRGDAQRGVLIRVDQQGDVVAVSIATLATYESAVRARVVPRAEATWRVKSAYPEALVAALEAHRRPKREVAPAAEAPKAPATEAPRAPAKAAEDAAFEALAAARGAEDEGDAAAARRHYGDASRLLEEAAEAPARSADARRLLRAKAEEFAALAVEPLPPPPPPFDEADPEPSDAPAPSLARMEQRYESLQTSDLERRLAALDPSKGRAAPPIESLRERLAALRDGDASGPAFRDAPDLSWLDDEDDEDDDAIVARALAAARLERRDASADGDAAIRDLAEGLDDGDTPPPASEGDQVADLLREARALRARAADDLAEDDGAAPAEPTADGAAPAADEPAADGAEAAAPTDVAALLRRVDALRAEAATVAPPPAESAEAPAADAPSPRPRPTSRAERRPPELLPDYDDDSAHDASPPHSSDGNDY